MARKEKTQRRRLAGAWLSSVLSISLVLILVGAAAILAVNARKVSNYFKEHMQMEVLFHQEVSEAQAEAYAASLEGRPFVNTTRLVTREEGAMELQEMLGEDFLSVFEGTSVPLSLELTLKADYVNADSLAMVDAALRESPLVEGVESRTPLVDALNSNLSTLGIVLGVLILLMLFISFVLIGNTVRLNILARRFTVRTMQLVGAGRSYIRRPFMRSALVMGLTASLIAIAAIAAALYTAFRGFPQAEGLFGWQGMAVTALIIIVTGVGICLISTFFAVNRVTDMDKDQLYY